MASRTLAGALRAYVEPLQRAVSVISPATLTTDCWKPSEGEEYFLILGDGDVVRVPRADRGYLGVRIEHRFRLVRAGGHPGRRDAWKATITKYQFALYDEGDREVLAYHWHPAEQGNDEPHLHLSSGSGSLRPELQRAHLPTARIAVEEFVLFVIREFAARVRTQAYRRILAESLARFRQERSWG